METSSKKQSTFGLKSKKTGQTTKESDIQRAILEYLRKIKNYTVWRSYVGPVIHRTGKFSKNKEMAGFPDITGFLKTKPYQMFCIEVKSKNGTISSDQIRWHKLLRKHGVPVIIARSLQEVIDLLSIMEDDKGMPQQK